MYNDIKEISRQYNYDTKLFIICYFSDVGDEKMKIERISENKIKVFVSSDDVKIWNVDLKNFTDNTPEAQDLFWFALKQAEKDVAFSIGPAQLMVETLPTVNDGFAMIISKLETDADIAEALLRSGKRLKRSEFKLSKRDRSISLMRIFRFSNFDVLCDAVAEIYELYLGESRLFKYKNEFYLEVSPRDSFGLFEIENIISEFASKEKNPSVLQGILNEYAELMIETDAISVISKNFIK